MKFGINNFTTTVIYNVCKNIIQRLGYRLDGRVSILDSGNKGLFFLFATVFRLTPGRTQPPVKWT